MRWPLASVRGTGGPRIISSVFNVLLGVTDYSRSLDQAMLALRPHHQWQPDLVYFDTEPPREVREYLAQRGHEVASQRKTGMVQAIIRTEEGWLGASDPRKGGQPAGY
ncbi:MAG: gamma-glutamyltransferase [Planctomycetes bacterium]|nr:gamma-glutamyltransferase [Planctomycetota bacterium]